MQLVLYDTPERTALYPFTHTRAVADIRCGILTLRERWERLLRMPASGTLTETYLQAIYPAIPKGDTLLIDGAILATSEFAAAISNLQPGEALMHDNQVVTARMDYDVPNYSSADSLTGLKRLELNSELKKLRRPWDIFSLNDWAIRQDYALLTTGKFSAPLPKDIVTKGTDIFIEEGAQIGPGVILNASSGPIYVGQHAEIMEGAIVRGPFALCEGAVLKMGAKIYGGTTIGPGCKVGGEVSNAVFFANSNKGHDGFVGNAVIGEWCNLGADTNCSNLKNNYDAVKVWDEAARKSVATGLTFCGLLMGDHSKCGINTMFNTGTITGVSCNIWGSGFPEKFLPSFTWGGPDGMNTYQFARAMDTAERMMARRGKVLIGAERAMLQHVFESTASSRSLVFKDDSN